MIINKKKQRVTRLYILYTMINDQFEQKTAGKKTCHKYYGQQQKNQMIKKKRMQNFW